MAKLTYLLRELMIGCESEPLSLKSEYALICSIVLIRLTVVKLNASRKSKVERRTNSQTRARNSS
jgi:uncharacterized membrane protein (DUF373 family)